MLTPPGFVQIIRFLPLFFLPPFGAHVALKVAQEYFGLHISHGILLSYIVSYPAVLLCRLMFSKALNRVEAFRMGAVFPPHVNDSPWGIYRQRSSEHGRLYIGDAFARWAETYGNTFAFTITQYRIFTLEPVHVKAILATQFDDFDKGPEAFDRFFSLLGTGIFSSDGDAWKFHRSIARPFFSKGRISDFTTFGKHADQAIACIADRLSDGQPVEFQDVAARFTLDTATEFLFGKSVDSMAAGLEYPESSGIKNPPSFTAHPSNAFVKAFSEGQQAISIRGRLGRLWRLREFWKDEVRPYREEVNKYIDPIIKEALAEQSNDEKDHETLLSSLISQTQDYKVIQDQLVNILVAGRDTTASTLMFAVYMLTQHPNIVQRLRDEIIAKVGETRSPTYEDIRDMKYLRAFINETLRLYPIVPSNSRTSNRSTTLPSPTPGGQPFYVPANTQCVYSVFLMHRRTDLWGPDASEFDPDRFIDERLHKYLTPNPFIFLPFNGGPRICLGQQFAYNEMEFFLIRLLQKFSAFSLAPDAQPKSSLPPEEWRGCPGTKGRDKIRIDAALTMSARGGMWVRMKEVKPTQ